MTARRDGTTPPVDEVDGELVASLPVLEEVPELAHALAIARSVDRLIAQLVDAISHLERCDLAGAVTGLDLDHWLAAVGGRTRSDRRMLLTAAELCARIPSLREAFVVQGSISWAQARAIICLLESLPPALAPAIDRAIAPVLTHAAGTDPDDLLHAVRIAIRGLPDEGGAVPERPSPSFTPFLAMQPRLDGSGGQLFGELDAVGFATVDAALTAPHAAHRDGDAEEVREPNVAGEAEVGPDGGQAGSSPRWIGGRATAQCRAQRLVELCDGALTGAHGPGAIARGSDGAASPVGAIVDPGGGPMGSRPQLLIRTELASLLDGDQMPASLLTTLTGGRLGLDATSLRELIEARGADLRMVVLDDLGHVVGVGRRRRVPPGWLSDATAALHDTCSHPGCRRGVRACDTDHAIPWHPARPGDPPGRTDIDQLAPSCRFHNRTKETAGWVVTQHPDGSRVWHHPATGLTTRTLPATWRPPPRDGPGP